MCPNKLQEHLYLNSEMYSTYLQFRQAIEAYLESKDTYLDPDKMSIGELGKRGKGEGKGVGDPVAGCWDCGGLYSIASHIPQGLG